MTIDFHCHISTPDSRLPELARSDGSAMPNIAQASQLIGTWTQDAIYAVAETWRTPAALKAYRNLSPFISGEMSRRILAATTASLLAEMAQNGVNKSVVVGLDPFIPTESVLRECSTLSGVLYPFGSVDPQSADYLKRFGDLLEQPIYGLKFHSDLQGLPLDSPRLANMMTVLQDSRRRLPVYLHTGNFPIYPPLESPWYRALPELVGGFPDVTFICGHAGWEDPAAALACAKKHENLLIETSWQPASAIRNLCDEIGPERLLFGSDYPLFSQKRALRNLRKALTLREFELVSNENGQDLLSLNRPF